MVEGSTSKHDTVPMAADCNCRDSDVNKTHAALWPRVRKRSFIIPKYQMLDTLAGGLEADRLRVFFFFFYNITSAFGDVSVVQMERVKL